MAKIESTQPAEQTVLEAIRDAVQEMQRQTTVAVDISERIQQQLAKINEDENLVAGERHYDG